MATCEGESMDQLRRACTERTRPSKGSIMQSWKTTVSGLVTAAAGFVLFKPEHFTAWPWVVDLAKYIMLGGIACLGIFGKDSNVTGAAAPPSKDEAAK